MTNPDLDYEPYKEPLAKVEDGFGYIGTIGKSKDGTKIQCHICGGMFSNLGSHANKKHHINARDYKRKFKLRAKTSLLAPTLTEQYVRIAQAADSELIMKRLAALKMGRQTPRNPERGRKTLEQKNIEGVCPDQLIQKIKDLSVILGHTPSLREFGKHYDGLRGPVYRTFGSYVVAVKIAGLLPSKNRGRQTIYSKELIIDMIQRFEKRHNRRPYTSDLGRDLPSQWTFKKYFGGFSAAIKEASR
jgi:hypothetical protein